MSDADPAVKFIASMQYLFHMQWWTSIRLKDCGERVYRHAVINCRCNRTQSEAYSAWRAENPEAAALNDGLYEKGTYGT